MDMPIAIVIHRSEAGHTGPEVDATERAHGCGYHYFIRRDGTIDVMHAWGETVNHALAWSRHTISVAVHGDFDPREHSRNAEPTAEQLKSLERLCLALYDTYGPLPIVGHTDLPGGTTYADKRCPGPNLNVRTVQVWVLEKYRTLAKAEVPTA